MVIPDANLLIYTFNRDSKYHEQAKVWWEELVQGSEYIGLDWSVVITFLRLTTNPIMFPKGVDIENSLKVVRSWLDIDHVHVIYPGSQHFDILSSLLIQARVGHNLVPDIHLAALAIENRATLHSHDRDFQRFSGLKLHDPIKRA
ncbi:MAG: TA system VapC family ribonuclease toxin [Armatimonadota bacterium]